VFVGCVVTDGGAPTTTVYAREPAHPFASVAAIVKLYVFVAVGVPDSTPLADKVNPVGSAPVLLVNVYEPTALPVAEIFVLYTAFTRRFGRFVGFTVIVGQFICNVYALATEHPEESVAVTVNE
jgi:nitrate/nitrite transporter NarK